VDEEREQLLAREREAREEVTSLLESITDAFFAVDHQWRFTYVNREAERLLQRPRHELMGKVLWDEFSPAVGSVFQENYERAMSERVTVKFEEFYEELGIWVDVRAYLSEGGISVFFRDITPRKRAEDQLRQSEERFRELFENASEPIGTVTLDETAGLLGHAPRKVLLRPDRLRDCAVARDASVGGIGKDREHRRPREQRRGDSRPAARRPKCARPLLADCAVPTFRWLRRRRFRPISVVPRPAPRPPRPRSAACCSTSPGRRPMRPGG